MIASFVGDVVGQASSISKMFSQKFINPPAPKRKERDMSRYVDAEWLKELYKPYKSYNGKELAVPIGAILANIDDAPTIDLVRCKECKHCDYVDMKTHLWCDCQEHYVLADDYCSYGEREGE